MHDRRQLALARDAVGDLDDLIDEMFDLGLPCARVARRKPLVILDCPPADGSTGGLSQLDYPALGANWC